MTPDPFQNAYLGSLVADAVSMPVHWYYDREALRAEYGEITGYLAPKNPHSGSILWRSHYTAPNEKGEILHDQAAYWGQRGIHYHQFLKAGENTLNFQLATELVRLCEKNGGYHRSTLQPRVLHRRVDAGLALPRMEVSRQL